MKPESPSIWSPTLIWIAAAAAMVPWALGAVVIGAAAGVAWWAATWPSGPLICGFVNSRPEQSGAVPHPERTFQGERRCPRAK